MKQIPKRDNKIAYPKPSNISLGLALAVVLKRYEKAMKELQLH